MTCSFSLLYSISVGSIIQRGVLSYKSQIESRHKRVVPNYGEWRVCVCGGGGRFYPCKKGEWGWGVSFSHAEVGDTNIFEVVFS